MCLFQYESHFLITRFAGRTQCGIGARMVRYTIWCFLLFVESNTGDRPPPRKQRTLQLLGFRPPARKTLDEVVLRPPGVQTLAETESGTVALNTSLLNLMNVGNVNRSVTRRCFVTYDASSSIADTGELLISGMTCLKKTSGSSEEPVLENWGVNVCNSVAITFFQTRATSGEQIQITNVICDATTGIDEYNKIIDKQMANITLATNRMIIAQGGQGPCVQLGHPGTAADALPFFPRGDTYYVWDRTNVFEYNQYENVRGSDPKLHLFVEDTNNE